MKTTSIVWALIIGAAMPLSVAANPPSWAGQGGRHGASAHGGASQADNPRFSSSEREYMRGYVHNHADDPALPPGLRKNAARGKSLPPGWQKKVRVGHRLPDDLYYQGRPLPAGFYGGDFRRRDGYTDILLDNEVVRVLDATQTIVDVFGLDR